MKSADAEFPESAADVEKIRLLHLELSKGPAEYTFPFAVPISHAQEYATDMARLKYYAGKTVNNRVKQFQAVTLVKTWFFLDMYVDGLDKGNPYSLVFSTRSEMETFAVVFDTVARIKKHSGDHPKDYAARVQLVDNALIRAAYGTKHARHKEIWLKLGQSRLRPTQKRDEEAIEARNIMTHIQRVARLSRFSGFEDVYDRLSDYLHPNLAQNNIITWPAGSQSVPVEELAKASRVEPRIIQLATAATCRAMAISAEGAMRAFDDLKPPFAPTLDDRYRKSQVL